MAMGGEHMEDEYFWALWEVVFKGRYPVLVAEACRTMDLILIMNENAKESKKLSARWYHGCHLIQPIIIQVQ